MSQSVILLTDVAGLGQIGDKKTVKEGYARNYLIPQRLAIPTTSNAINRAERQKGKIEADRKKLMEKAQGMAERISKVGLIFERPVGQGGRLFGSITPLDIALELARQGASVEKRSILMQGPLKTPGDHVIRVRIHSQVVVDVPVKVIGIEVKQSKTEPEPIEEATKPREKVKEETKKKD